MQSISSLARRTTLRRLRPSVVLLAVSVVGATASAQDSAGLRDTPPERPPSIVIEGDQWAQPQSRPARDPEQAEPRWAEAPAQRERGSAQRQAPGREQPSRREPGPGREPGPVQHHPTHPPVPAHPGPPSLAAPRPARPGISPYAPDTRPQLAAPHAPAGGPPREQVRVQVQATGMHSLEDVLESQSIQKILELIRENAELKAELKVLEVKAESEVAMMRLRNELELEKAKVLIEQFEAKIEELLKERELARRAHDEQRAVMERDADEMRNAMERELAQAARQREMALEQQRATQAVLRDTERELQQVHEEKEHAQGQGAPKEEALERAQRASEEMMERLRSVEQERLEQSKRRENYEAVIAELRDRNRDLARSLDKRTITGKEMEAMAEKLEAQERRSDELRREAQVKIAQAMAEANQLKQELETRNKIIAELEHRSRLMETKLEAMQKQWSESKRENSKPPKRRKSGSGDNADEQQDAVELNDETKEREEDQ